MAEKKVKSNTMVTVYGTGKSRFMPKGVAYNVHAIAAEKLIADKKAQTEKPLEGKK